MAVTRQDIIDNLLAMMAVNSSSTDAAGSQLRFAEEIADSIIDYVGQGVDENWTTVLSTPYAVLETDSQLRVVLDGVLNLPEIGPGIGQVPIGKYYRIFARNVNVTINAANSDLINGETDIQIKKYQSFTVRASALLDWVIGD